MYLSVTESDLNEGNSALTVPDQTEAPSVMETASRSSGRRLATQAWFWTADGLDHSLLPLGAVHPPSSWHVAQTWPINTSQQAWVDPHWTGQPKICTNHICLMRASPRPLLDTSFAWAH